MSNNFHPYDPTIYVVDLEFFVFSLGKEKSDDLLKDFKECLDIQAGLTAIVPADAPRLAEPNPSEERLFSRLKTKATGTWAPGLPPADKNGE